MSGRSPLHGYNTNYRREGNLYHVQTEDLGENSAAVVTQVFTGGTILATRRTEYSHILDAAEDEFLPMLQRLMQQQHKEMLIGLRDGTLELTVDPNLSTERDASEMEGGRDTVQMELPPDFLEELEQELKFDEDSDETIMVDSVQLIAEEVVDAEMRESDIPLVDIDSLAPTPPPIKAGEDLSKLGKHLTAGTPPPPPPMTDTPMPPPLESATDMEDSVTLSSTPNVETSQRESQITDIPLAVPVSETTTPPPLPKSHPPRRDAPSEPEEKEAEQDSKAPRIFSEVSRPAPGFGEDQLGERSLDEVILSYLAEELQEDS